MKRIMLLVEGMSCGHCEKRIEDAIKDMENIITAKANFAEKSLEIIYEGQLDFEQVKKKIEAEGYEVL